MGRHRIHCSRLHQTHDVVAMTVTREQVLAVLDQVKSPDGLPLPRTGTLSEVVASDGKVFFSITVDADAVKAWEPVRQRAEEAVRAIPAVQSALVALTAERKGGAQAARPTQPAPRHAGAGARSEAPQGAPGVAAIIAVASGKGGVGKSTAAVNLALGLQALGHKVGILDADIYGPSQPRLLGLKGQPQIVSGKTLKPMEGYGLKVMSMGFLVDEETPVIWRGAMVVGALNQMLRDVAWGEDGELDVLVIDMPPGTGDVQLTMAQQVPLSGAVIVSTPQDLALIDARKGLAMFRKVGVPVLGIVENMSYFTCPKCGEQSHIFGHGGAEAEAKRLGVPFLGAIPLDMEIRARSDSGQPVTATQPESALAETFREVAVRTWAELQTAQEVAAKPPKLGLSPNGDALTVEFACGSKYELRAELLRVMS